MTGKDNQLKNLSHLPQQSRSQSSPKVGVINVALEKIVGSEGRTRDFDSAFNPLKAQNSARWIGIAVARRQGTVLSPVEQIQLGDEYYVRDGHHRISVAKAVGQLEIEARILYVQAYWLKLFTSFFNYLNRNKFCPEIRWFNSDPLSKFGSSFSLV